MYAGVSPQSLHSNIVLSNFDNLTNPVIAVSRSLDDNVVSRLRLSKKDFRAEQASKQSKQASRKASRQALRGHSVGAMPWRDLLHDYLCLYLVYLQRHTPINFMYRYVVTFRI